MQKSCDWLLGFIIPVHMHISTNSLVTDYVPRAMRSASPAASRCSPALPGCLQRAESACACRTADDPRARAAPAEPAPARQVQTGSAASLAPPPAAPARGFILGCTAITYLGLMKVNLTGPGLTQTVKMLWSKQPAPAK